MLKALFGLEYDTIDEWNEYLEDKSFTMTFMNQFGEVEDHAISFACANLGNGSAIYVSLDLFNELYPFVLTYYGIVASNADVIVSLYERFGDNGLSPELTTVVYANKLASFISSYASLFQFLSYFILSATLLLFLYMSYESVKRKTYQIGVFKALGLSNRDLYGVYLFNLALQIVLSATFYMLFANVLSLSANAVLVSAIEIKTGYGSYLAGINIFALGLSVALLSLGIMLLALFIGVFIPLWNIRKIKPVEIIRNKY